MTTDSTPNQENQNLPVEKDSSLVIAPQPCPVCHQPADKNVVACTKCGSHHHEKCWREAKGCSNSDCGCRISESLEKRETEDSENTEVWFYNDSDGSLVVDSHVSEIEDPLAGGMCFGCFSIVAGWIFNTWLYTNGWYLLGVSFTLFIIADSFFRHRLRINATGGAITRETRFSSSVLSHNNSYLFLDEIAELHLHTQKVEEDEEETKNKTADSSSNENKDEEKPVKAGSTAKQSAKKKPDKFDYYLYAVNLEGERKLMFARKSRCRDEVMAVVDKIAMTADVTVRTFKKGEQPSPQQIADAVKARRLEARIDEHQ